jgi:secondary thiamine-phosphate synthase enzyme
MKTSDLALESGRELTDITEQVREFCADLQDGLLNVFALHSTVGLVLMQSSGGSDVDVLAALRRLIPRDIEYAHREKAPGHGADHIMPVLCGASVTIPVEAGALLMGEFQQLVFIDLDEQPSERKVRLTFINDGGPA